MSKKNNAKLVNLSIVLTGDFTNVITGLGISEEKTEEMKPVLLNALQKAITEEGYDVPQALVEIVSHCQNINEVAFFCYSFGRNTQRAREKFAENPIIGMLSQLMKK